MSRTRYASKSLHEVWLFTKILLNTKHSISTVASKPIINTDYAVIMNLLRLVIH